jgi:hypothetical protein
LNDDIDWRKMGGGDFSPIKFLNKSKFKKRKNVNNNINKRHLKVFLYVECSRLTSKNSVNNLKPIHATPTGNETNSWPVSILEQTVSPLTAR